MIAAPALRRTLLGGALAFTFAAVWWVDTNDDASTGARAEATGDGRPHRAPRRAASRPEVHAAPGVADAVHGEPLPVPAHRTTAANASAPSAASPATSPVGASSRGAPSMPPSSVRDTSLDPSRVRRDARPVVADAFAARSWAPPPKRLPPVAAVDLPPPPPPEPPPLPYTYLGMLGDGDRTTLFLAQGDHDVAVREGDVVDGVWRLDHVDAQRAQFTYLPLQKPRSLNLGTR